MTQRTKNSKKAAPWATPHLGLGARQGTAKKAALGPPRFFPAHGALLTLAPAMGQLSEQCRDGFKLPIVQPLEQSRALIFERAPLPFVFDRAGPYQGIDRHAENVGDARRYIEARRLLSRLPPADDVGAVDSAPFR